MLESPPRPVLIDDFTHHRFKCEIERVVIMDAVKTNFLVTLGGLRFSLPVSGNGFLSWDSIVQVEWSQTWRWFVLHTPDGRKLRVSGLLRGLPQLAQALLGSLPRNRFSDAAHALLVDRRR